MRLSEQYGIPMITAYGRNDAVPNAHPLYVGPLGRAGSPEAAAACRRADLILAVGSRLAQFTTHFDDRYIRPETPIVQIDVEEPRHRPLLSGGRRHPGRRARGVPGAARRARPRGRRAGAEPAWRQEAEALREQRQARLDGEAKLDAQPLKPQRVYAELRRALPPDTIVALDAGAAPAYGYDRLQFSRPRTFLTPLDLGGLGFAFPVALGAKLGRPDGAGARHPRRRRLSHERPGAGDGGAPRHQRGHARDEQQLLGLGEGLPAAFYGGRYIGCDIGNPRYDAFARLFGAEGYYAEHARPGRRRRAGGARLRQAGRGRDPDRSRRVPDAGGRDPTTAADVAATIVHDTTIVTGDDAGAIHYGAAWSSRAAASRPSAPRPRRSGGIRRPSAWTADLIVVDLRTPHLAPVLRVVSDFVHNGQAGDVESVMVDGRWIMRDRRVLTLDEPALVAEAERVARAAWRRLFTERPDLPRPPGLDLG